MKTVNGLQQQVLNLDEKDFQSVALDIFRFQANGNPVYKMFVEHLDIDPMAISSIEQIPFLPIELFKTQKVVTGDWKEQQIFSSSGTGQGNVSRHFIKELNFYERMTLSTFKSFYGSPDRYHILALLPSYLDRKDSSLVHMVNHFINESASPFSGFYLTEYELLQEHLQELTTTNDRQVMLWGVSFALLNLAERYPMDLSESIIVETGGMKGRRREIIRADLHAQLQKAFNCNQINSEYGMAELSSQAYSKGEYFQLSAWMKVLIRNISDPFEFLPPGRVGGINVIDLGNVHSCAFIETQDLGEVINDGSFQVLGRMDNSEVRGCNLMFRE